jgi:hypothetical protein
MTRIRIMGLCLVAAFALSALAASGASASPTYWVCAKASPKNTGNWAEKTCQTLASPEGTGKYELIPAANVSYTSKSKTVELETPGVGTVVCKKSADVGTIVDETSDKDVVTFSSCATSGKKCTSAGEPAGTIKTFELLSSLTENGKNEVEEVLTGNGPGGLSAEFECEGIVIRTRGNAGGIVTGDVNTGDKEDAVDFTSESKQELESEVVGLTPFLHSVEKTKAENKNGAVVFVKAPLISVAPNPVNFGKLVFGEKKVEIVVVTIKQTVEFHTATNTVAKAALVPAGPPFSFGARNTCTGLIHALEKCEIEVIYEPQAAGENIVRKLNIPYKDPFIGPPNVFVETVAVEGKS